MKTEYMGYSYEIVWVEQGPYCGVHVRIWDPHGDKIKTLPSMGYPAYSTEKRAESMAQTYITNDIEAIRSHAETTAEFGI